MAPPLKATSSAGPMPGGGLRGAHVGAHRDVHADEAAGARQHRAEHEADGRLAVQEDEDQHRQHHADDGDGLVLPRQVGRGALLDGAGDLLHAGVAGVLAQDPAALDRSRRSRRPGRTPALRRAPSGGHERSPSSVEGSLCEVNADRARRCRYRSAGARKRGHATGWPCRPSGVCQALPVANAAGGASGAGKGGACPRIPVAPRPAPTRESPP
jgi:hypothetical protein